MQHRPNHDTFRIGTFNLFNLVLPEHTYYGRKKYTQEEFNKKKAWINHQLLNMQADIVGFQEVFHQEALAEILQANPRYKGGTHMLVADPTGDRPSVGLISRFAVEDYEFIHQFPEQLDIDGVKIPFTHFSRPILKARLRLNADNCLTVFVAHLKSKRPVFGDGDDVSDPLELAKAQACSLMVRAAEAYALRSVLMTELKDRNAPVVVMGDFNDNHTAVTTQLISGEPPFRHLPMDKKLKQWDILLYHAKDIQARLSYMDTYYTHIHNGHHESLDHIMVSQELVAENPRSIGRVGFVKVFNDHLIDETLSSERMPCWKSDHAQVSVTVEFNAGKLDFLNSPTLD